MKKIKKKEWTLTLCDGNGAPKLVGDMVAHCEINGELLSLGTMFHNGKYIGTIQTKSSNFLHKDKKPKTPTKSFAYELAHRLAVAHFTNRRVNKADEMVMEHF
jgi:hypothetical protein